MKQGVSLPKTTDKDKTELVNLGYLNLEDGQYTLTREAKLLIVSLDNYFIKAKKKNENRT